MNAVVNCPFCGGEIDADYVLDNDKVACPRCSKILVDETGNDDVPEDNDWDRLLDPTDPIGYLNNFPPEDDY